MDASQERAALSQAAGLLQQVEKVLSQSGDHTSATIRLGVQRLIAHVPPDVLQQQPPQAPATVEGDPREQQG